MSSHRRLMMLRLGRVEYEDGLALQRLVGEARLRELMPDTLLLLEHPPVLTLGRGATGENILAPAGRLESLGVETFETDRGGDVTFHGPGQVVGYPIFLLAPDRQDVRKYIRNLEEAIVRALARFEITAGRIPKWPGVWLGDIGADPRKIAAIGVHLSRWVSSHGFALNVNTDLSFFDLIVPCGLQGTRVTSIQRELGRPVEASTVENALAATFAAVFEAELVPPLLTATRTVSVAVMRETVTGPQFLLVERTPERGGFWQIITGRVESSETPHHAAQRELFEETSLQVSVEPLSYVHSFPVARDVPPALVEETAFVARAPGDAVIRLSGEHRGWEWVAAEEAMRRLPFKGLKEAVRLACAAGFGPRSI